jgi:hypothetical protein
VRDYINGAEKTLPFSCLNFAKRLKTLRRLTMSTSAKSGQISRADSDTIQPISPRDRTPRLAPWQPVRWTPPTG